jgi:hypothetical protein
MCNRRADPARRTQPATHAHLNPDSRGPLRVGVWVHASRGLSARRVIRVHRFRELGFTFFTLVSETVRGDAIQKLADSR